MRGPADGLRSAHKQDGPCALGTTPDGKTAFMRLVEVVGQRVAGEIDVRPVGL